MMLASCYKWPPVQSIWRLRFIVFTQKSVNQGQNEGIIDKCRGKWIPNVQYEVLAVWEEKEEEDGENAVFGTARFSM